MPHRKHHAKGFSLIEVVIILLFISVAMIPVVNNIGISVGQTGTNANQMRTGSGTRIIGMKQKEVLLANALMERLLAGDTSVFNTPIDALGSCTAVSGGIPQLNSGQTSTFRCVNRQLGGAMGSANTAQRDAVFYEWIVTDRSREFPGNAGNKNTMGNDFFRATLNVYDNNQYTNPILTMPSIAFRNNQAPEEKKNVTGIAIVLDTSGSMFSSGLDRNGNEIPDVEYTWAPSPYRYYPMLPYRYRMTDTVNGTQVTYNPPVTVPAITDIFNNATMDIVMAQNTDNPDTDFDDRFPSSNLAHGNGYVVNCGINTSPVFGARGVRPSDIVNQNTAGQSWYNLCRRYDKTNSPFNGAGVTTYDENLPRIEAARSSLLQFLFTIEKDPTLRSNIRLGFVGYNDDPDYEVPASATGGLESPNASGKYERVRKRLSWLNRAGDSRFEHDNGWTHTWEGVSAGARLLYNSANADLTGRVIFLVTDGVPTRSNCNGLDWVPNQSTADNIGNCFKNDTLRDPFSGVTIRGLGKSLGDGTYPGADGKKITTYALGIMERETYIRSIIEEGLVKPTKGDFLYTESMGEMSAMFENIKYAILKEIIKSNAGRYGINYD